MYCTNDCGTVFDRPPLSMYVADDLVGNAYWGYYCSHACALQDMGGALLNYAEGPQEVASETSYGFTGVTAEGTTNPFDGLIGGPPSVPLGVVLEDIANDSVSTSDPSTDQVVDLYARSHDQVIYLANYLLDQIDDLHLTEEKDIDQHFAGQPVKLLSVTLAGKTVPITLKFNHSVSVINFVCEEKGIVWAWNLDQFEADPDLTFNIKEAVLSSFYQGASL